MRLEDRLRQAESHTEISSFLWAQWCFDKALVSKSLSVINTIFPHYSLHDSSHSISIISEMEKILGPNIESLSFVDTWLLLEAAYWHDIGMIVPHSEKAEILRRPGFRTFLEQIESNGTDYADYARTYKSYLDGSSRASILEVERSFTFLLAEYIRRTHPERGKQFLLGPDAVGIKSPDTGLINSRLFVLLGDIIVCHGKSFSSVLGLPYENDGLEVGDVAHPRLVASLLRLGDLLDLDDGRHCPTQLLAVGKLPALSQAHLEKHRSIVNKSVNSHSIEIRAKCQTFESFEVQNDWFGYIEKEIEDQDKHWGDIAPKSYVGKLPTIRGLVCDLENSVSLGRKASRFSIDENRIYDFLTGKSIYENPLAAILEILQNSVDATIDRIWLEHQDKIADVMSFRAFAKGYSIDVSVSAKEAPDKKVEYQVAITDSGKGMTLDDIRSILTIASEQSQNRKQVARLGMPSWMRPSGFFGIGLQSVFSLSNEIHIETQSAGDLPYDIDIRSTKGKTPSFVVRKRKADKWKFGTTVRFTIIEDAIPDHVSGKLAIFEVLARFDPLKDLVLTAKQAQIKEQVAEFAHFCEFSVAFNGSELECYRDQFKICDSENGIEYAIEFMQLARLNEWQFRGRPFKTSWIFKYFNIRGNIISERADSFLPLSREKIHRSGQELLEAKIMSSLESKKEQILSVITNRPLASFYYFLQGTPVDDSWKMISLSGTPLGQLIALDRTLYVSLELTDCETVTGLDTSAILVGNQSRDAELLIDAALKLELGVAILEIKKYKEPVSRFGGQTRTVTVFQIEFKKNKALSSISNEALKYISEDKLSDTRERYWLPCGPDQFPNLSVSTMSEYPWILPLTPFYQFFDHGIVLRSTSMSLDQDIPTLIKELIKHKPSLLESEIEGSLREFYRMYSFEPKHNARSPWG